MAVEDDDDKAPLYRSGSGTEKPGSSSDDELINDLAKDLREEPQQEETQDVDDDDENDEDGSDEDGSEAPKEKRGQKRKPEAPPSENLLEQIEKAEMAQKPEENLSKEDYTIKWRILNAFQWIKATPRCKFALLLNDRDPTFLQQDFDNMPYEELKKAWKKFSAIQSMNQIVCGTENLYTHVGKLVEQGARNLLNYQGPVDFIHDHLQSYRDDDVLANITSHNPFKKNQISTFTQMFNVAAPIAYYAWQIHSFNQIKNQHEENSKKTLSVSEADAYLSFIPELLL